MVTRDMGAVRGFGLLAFSGFDFVSTEVFLCLGVDSVLFSDGVVLLQLQLVWGILRIFLRIVRTVIAQTAHQTN